jgi:hypothetical protein
MSDWMCSNCGFENDKDIENCLVCGNPRPEDKTNKSKLKKSEVIRLDSSSDDENEVAFVKHTPAGSECIDLTMLPDDENIVDLTGLPDEVEKELIDPTTDGRNICVYFNPSRASSDQELLLLRYNTPSFLMDLISSSKVYIQQLLFSRVQYLRGGFWGNFIRTQEQHALLTPADLALIRIGDFKMEYNGDKELKFSVIHANNIQGAMKTLDVIGFRQRLPFDILQDLYNTDERFHAFLNTIFKKLFLESLIDTREKKSMIKAFSVDYYFDRNRGQYGYHYDDTPGIRVKNVSLTYVGDQDIVIKGAQVASSGESRAGSRCAISLPVTGGYTLRFNNQHLTHTTPKPEASASSKEGSMERDQRGNIFRQESIHREPASPRRESRAQAITTNTSERTRSFLRFWEVVEYNVRENRDSSTAERFLSPESIESIPFCIFTDNTSATHIVPSVSFTDNMQELFTYLDTEIFAPSSDGKTLIVTSETDDPDEVLRTIIPFTLGGKIRFKSMKTRKGRKGRKGRKSRKSRKGKKSKKSRKSRK